MVVLWPNFWSFMCRNVGQTKMSLIYKYFHEKVQIWEVRECGGWYRKEIHYHDPAEKQSDDHFHFGAAMMAKKMPRSPWQWFWKNTWGSSQTATPHSLQGGSGETPEIKHELQIPISTILCNEEPCCWQWCGSRLSGRLVRSCRAWSRKVFRHTNSRIWLLNKYLSHFVRDSPCILVSNISSSRGRLPSDFCLKIWTTDDFMTSDCF